MVEILKVAFALPLRILISLIIEILVGMLPLRLTFLRLSTLSVGRLLLKLLSVLASMRILQLD